MNLIEFSERVFPFHDETTANKLSSMLLCLPLIHW